MRQMIAGGIAGVMSRIVVAPVDVLKIRWQLESAQISKSSVSLWRTFNQMVSQEGYRALWKGNWAAEWLYLTYGAVQFPVYHSLRDQLKSRLDDRLNVDMVAGGLAGAFATTLTYPFDLLRTRFAAQGSKPIYVSLRGAARQIWHDEGVSGFYRGLQPSLLQIVPYMAVMFGTYEFTHNRISQLDTGFFSPSCLRGAVSGEVAKSSVMPFDVLRKRLQVQGPTRPFYAVQNITEYQRGIWQMWSHMVMHEGWRGLFRGWVPSMLKSSIGSASTFFCYELSLNLIHSFGE